MKANVSRMLRSGLAMLLVLCMVVGFVPSAVFATDGESGKTINYVSIGDSMANGYCFDGYAQGSGDVNHDKYNFATGEYAYGAGAYPLQFEAMLKELYGDDNVTHTKLAPSALLAEDLLYLLGVGEKPENDWSGYEDYVGGLSDEELMPLFQNAVTDANIITMGIGNASFGAYMLALVTDAIGIMGAEPGEVKVNLDMAIASLDSEEQEIVRDIYVELMTNLDGRVSPEMKEQYNVEGICDIVAYTVASFIISYKGSLERIIELNSDVEIVLVGLLNTTYGMKITAEGMDPIPVGDIMDKVFSALNTYIAGLPAVMQAKGEWKDAKFYYAEQPNPKFICQVFDDLKANNWENIQNDRLSGITVRKRNIAAFNEMLGYMIGVAITGEPLKNITLEDVQNYEANHRGEGITSSWGNMWKIYGAEVADYEMAIAIYLGIEDAVAASIDVEEIPLTALMNIASVEGLLGAFAGLDMEATKASPEATRSVLGAHLLSSNDTAAMCKIYALFKVGNGMSVHPTPEGHDEIAKAVIAAYTGGHLVQFETLDTIYDLLVDNRFSTADKVAAFEMLLNSLEPSKEVKTFKEIYTFLSSNSDYLTDEQTIAILIKIVDALRDDLSLSEDEISDLVNFIFDMFMEKDNEAKKAIALGIFNILKANGYIMGYDALLNNVWNQWVDHYGADVEKTIDKLVDRVEARYGTYEKLLLTLNTEMEELVATKDALETELVALKAALAEKKAELAAVIAKQEISGVTAPDINIEIDPNLGNNTQTTVPGNDCTVGGDSVKAELEKAIADLEHAIAVLEALISDVSADIADMAKLAAELAEAVKALGKTAKEITAAAKDLMEAMAAIKDVMTNESAYATAEQFKKAFEAAKVSAMEALDALKVASVIADELMVDVEYMLGEIITDGEALYEKIKADLPLVIENAPMEVKIALAAALMVAEEKGWDEEWAKDHIQQKLEDIIAEYQPEIDKAEAELKALKAKIELEVAAKYAVVEAQLKAEAAAKIAALEAKKAALKAELLALKAQLNAAEEAAKATIQAQIDRVTGDLAAIDADIAHINEHLKAALEIAYNEIVNEVNALYADAIAKLEKLIADLNAQLEAAIGKSLDELIVLGFEGLKALKDELIALGKAGITALVNKLVELHEQMLYNATHGEVLAGLKLNYVALGDGTNDFAAVLADLLAGKTPANINLVNAAKPGNTAASVAANLPAEVAGAHLITLGFSQTELIGTALNAFLNGEELNWTELVGADVAPYVAVALEYVYGEIDAMDLDETTATMVKAIAEAYAYGVADYAINLPVLIKNIREVNATAEIVIVGVHNPLENLAIELPLYGKIDLSAYTEIFDYMVDAVYGYGAALSVIAKDVIYVDAREVEIENDNLGFKEIDALLKGDISALYPSAKGDAYIAEQIANALTVKMLGDANGDGVVDSYDATLIARYDVGLIGANGLNLAVCDVNEDGVVDSYDATLVARYDVGLLGA